MTLGTVIYTAVWQGLGNAKLPFMLRLLVWLIRICGGLLSGVTLGLGLLGVWTATLWTIPFAGFFYKSFTNENEESNMTRAFIWDLDGTLLGFL